MKTMVFSGYPLRSEDSQGGSFDRSFYVIQYAQNAIGVLFPCHMPSPAKDEAGTDVILFWKKVTAMDVSDQLFGKPKLTRYSTTFARLLMLILDMSEEQQLLLLDQAKHIVDKRTIHRNPCLIPVKYTLEKRNYNSFMLDINAFGAYIETSEPFPVGRELYLTFFNPFSHKHIDLGGEIIWSSNYAIGVKFNNLPRHRTEMIDFFAETDKMNVKVS